MWQWIKNQYHLATALLANIYYRFPSRKLVVIGVTGTDGKTTTVSLIYHILKTSGKKASMISSVGAIIGGKEYDVGFHVTNPASWPLQGFIKKASQASEYLVLEVTSHGLDQFRVYGVRFNIGVITNITHEHLDYHKTYKNYVKAKAKLLQRADLAIVNKDDESYDLINKLLKKKKAVITYGKSKGSDISTDTFPFKTKLIGEFNTYNCLAAVSVCKQLGISDADIRKGVETFEAPIGREEIVYKKDFTVMIDFAHTPNSFEQVLSALRPLVKKRIIHVFGSAGQRDFTKRPKMGAISAKYADVVVLTSEDPRTESIDSIMKDIINGIKDAQERMENGTLLIIPNRQEAIAKAISIAQKGDLVITTGKAHEKSMNYGNGEEPWDEFGAVKKALEKNI
ncbi:MAG: UDP-N-acetylmuramoyl-L-alanyl-D-glutamate--2,6-diaminopimelate ligase [Candidatus Levybacteria bacterium]|nr:UDP-N-acetylmuramoyl-L-alanyl-D-glutamate--2,6-diaminopimelate ligase [Candidatus Levybacteria bacterium]